jgi:hypothetical protein
VGAPFACYTLSGDLAAVAHTPAHLARVLGYASISVGVLTPDAIVERHILERLNVDSHRQLAVGDEGEGEGEGEGPGAAAAAVVRLSPLVMLLDPDSWQPQESLPPPQQQERSQLQQPEQWQQLPPQHCQQPSEASQPAACSAPQCAELAEPPADTQQVLRICIPPPQPPPQQQQQPQLPSGLGVTLLINSLDASDFAPAGGCRLVGIAT